MSELGVALVCIVIGIVLFVAIASQIIHILAILVIAAGVIALLLLLFEGRRGRGRVRP